MLCNLCGLESRDAAKFCDGCGGALSRTVTRTGIDPELDAGFPRQRAARVAIDARGGRREELLQPTRVGDPDAPLSDRALEDKYMELAGPVLGEGPARKLLERLWRLEAAPALA